MSNYIFKILKNASFGKMKTAVKTCHKRSGKNSLKIFFDMLYCAKKYGAGYYDYQIFAFYNLTEEQRAGLTYGSKLWFTFPEKVTHLFDPETEESLLF